jgi:hypothetical protein
MEHVHVMFQCTHSFSCMVLAARVGISPASEFKSLSNTWEKGRFVRNGFHVLNDDQCAMLMLLSTSVGKERETNLLNTF